MQANPSGKIIGRTICRPEWVLTDRTLEAAGEEFITSEKTNNNREESG
jgi:hypothetical protein